MLQYTAHSNLCFKIAESLVLGTPLHQGLLGDLEHICRGIGLTLMEDSGRRQSNAYELHQPLTFDFV